MTEPLLRVEEMQTYLGDSHIIQGVSLEVPPGAVVALLGRNGAGKTTILRSIMRMVQPTSVRLVLLKSSSIILATAQLPQRRKAPMLAPRQMNVRAVRLP